MKKSLILFLIFALSGCSHELSSSISKIDIPLIPSLGTIQEIKNVNVTYIIPHNVEKSSNSLGGLKFEEYATGDSSKIERLRVSHNEQRLRIERRNDNGVAGSGLIYDINIAMTNNKDGTVITLTPKTRESYQEGLILPFPVPTFVIESYLSRAKLYYKFELDSEYQPASVEANIVRILGSDFINNFCHLKDEEGIKIKVNIFPYKNNGSKILVDSIIRAKSSSRTVINMTQIIKQLERKLQQVISS